LCGGARITGGFRRPGSATWPGVAGQDLLRERQLIIARYAFNAH
jgi:hypothetical protein